MIRRFHRFQRLHLVAPLAVATAAVIVLSCHASQAPILDLHDVDLRTTSGRTLTQKEVQTAALAGLAQKGWTVESNQSGVIQAKVSSGGHSATIRVDCRAGTYSIQHVSSTPGLRYDPERQIIHKRYNMWVDRLRLAIQANVPAK